MKRFTFYRVLPGLSLSVLMAVPAQPVWADDIQKLDYPWEIITLDMQLETVEKTIKEAGLEGTCRRGLRTRCDFKGRWKGKWESLIQIRASNDEINHLVFGVTYPDTAIQQIEDHILTGIPGGKHGPNCKTFNPLHIAVNFSLACSVTKDAANAENVKFTMTRPSSKSTTNVSYQVFTDYKKK